LLYTTSIYGTEKILGTLTVAGVAQDVTDHAVVQIPPNTKHAYTAKVDGFALQIYTPAGPEQRFKTAPPAKR
jgi:quercetin dioxygenase-like cupin family protein